jgi:hypothetical protein
MDVGWFIRHLEFCRDLGNDYAYVKLHALSFGHFVIIFCNFQEAVTRKPCFRRPRFSKNFLFVLCKMTFFKFGRAFFCTLYKSSLFVDMHVVGKKEKRSSVTAIYCSTTSLDVTNCVLSRGDCMGDCDMCKAQERQAATWTCWHVDG